MLEELEQAASTPSGKRKLTVDISEKEMEIKRSKLTLAAELEDAEVKKWSTEQIDNEFNRLRKEMLCAGDEEKLILGESVIVGLPKDTVSIFRFVFSVTYCKCDVGEKHKVLI